MDSVLSFPSVSSWFAASPALSQCPDSSGSWAASPGDSRPGPDMQCCQSLSSRSDRPMPSYSLGSVSSLTPLCLLILVWPSGLGNAGGSLNLLQHQFSTSHGRLDSLEVRRQARDWPRFPHGGVSWLSHASDLTVGTLAADYQAPGVKGPVLRLTGSVPAYFDWVR